MTLTCCHGGEDGAADSRQIGGVTGRRSHFIEGVCVVDVVSAKLFDDLGEKEWPDPAEQRIPRV